MNTRTSIRAAVALIVGLATASQVHAQAWPQEKGAGYYQLGVQVVRATRFYEPGGNLIDIPTLGDYQLSFYGERGLTNRLTIQAYIPFVERITLNRVEGEDTGFVFFDLPPLKRTGR